MASKARHGQERVGGSAPGMEHTFAGGGARRHICKERQLPSISTSSSPHRSLQASMAACRAAVWYSLVEGTAPDWLVRHVVGGGRPSRAAAALPQARSVMRRRRITPCAVGLRSSVPGAPGALCGAEPG